MNILIPIVINSLACLIYFILIVSAMFSDSHEDIMMVMTHFPTICILVAIFWLIYVQGDSHR